MLNYLLRRLAFFGLTLLLTSLIIFTLTRVLPGDVARAIAGREASQAQIEGIRAELGLDQPLPMQYVNWAVNFLRGDWGQTYTRPRQPILDTVLLRTRNSGRLALLTLLMSTPLAILLGAVAGLLEDKGPDHLISVLSLALSSLPEFVTGLFLINTLALWLGWFPASSSIRADASFAEALPALWLPAITATLVLTAYLARLTRAGVIEELKRDYVRMALLKGLPWPLVMWRHVLRNALIPTVTVIATSTGWLISGLVVIEFVFSYPGLGRLLMFAIQSRDLPTIQAVVMVTVLVILIANFIADMLYTLLDPRISLS